MNKPKKAREYNLPIQTKRDTLFIKPLKLIKEYLPLIVLVPVVIGGLWQIIALASISIPYVRFFSVTQLIADGFLTILVILPWLVCTYIYITLGEYFYAGISEGKKSSSAMKYFLLKGALSLFYILLMVAIVLLFFFVTLKTNNELIIYLAGIFSLYFVLFMLDAILFNGRWSRILDKTYENRFLKGPFIIFYTVFFLVILPMFFHSVFYKPYNLENFEKLKKYNQGKEIVPRYFNDKYIFLEHKKEDNSTTIQVVPFEALFNE